MTTHFTEPFKLPTIIQAPTCVSSIELAAFVFLASEGSSAKPDFDKLLSAGEAIPDTVMTSLVSGKKARTIKTPFIEKLVESYETTGFKPLPNYGYRYKAYKDLSKSLEGKIDTDVGFHLAGTNYAKMPPDSFVADIIKDLTSLLDTKNDFLLAVD